MPLIIFAVISVILGAIGLLGFEIVDTGYRGVKVVYGKVHPESLEEGIYFYNPFTTSIYEINVQTEKYDSETEAYTKDVQQAKLHIVVNYNLEKTKAHEILENVGRDWEDKLVPQAVNASAKTVTGRWDAVDLIANRAQAQEQLQQTLEQALGQRDVHITRVEIADIKYSPEFEKAVEAKVTAIQNAEQEKNKTVQIQEQSKQKVISAQAEAQSMKIRSEALSQNKSLVEYEAVQKWDGKLPNYMMGGSVPFINLTPEE